MKIPQTCELPTAIDALTGETESTAIYIARHFNYGQDPYQSPVHLQRRVLGLAANLRGRERKLVFSASLVALLPAELREVASAEFDRVFLNEKRRG